MTQFRWMILFSVFLSSLSADLMIVGIDEKMTWDEEGQLIKRDTDQNDRVDIYDLKSNPTSPKLISSFKLVNSIFGPPTNIAVNSDESMAYVANSLNWIQKDGEWNWEPSNELHLIKLGKKPKFLKTIQVGQQPSGIDISSDGSMLLVTNRADNSISVLNCVGKEAKAIQTIDVIDSPSGITISPDGKLALFQKKSVHKVGVLRIQDQKVTYNPDHDINVGLEPYNIKISPKGTIALVNNIGITNGNDGNADTVSVIDIQAERPHVIDQVTVGDGPEGLAFNPDGTMAVAVLINGSHKAKVDPKTAWAYHKNGAIAMLKIDGKKVTKTQHLEVGGMPEGAVFSEDGKYLYIGNFKSKDLTILKQQSGQFKIINASFDLKGAPASMGSSR